MYVHICIGEGGREGGEGGREERVGGRRALEEEGWREGGKGELQQSHTSQHTEHDGKWKNDADKTEEKRDEPLNLIHAMTVT